MYDRLSAWEHLRYLSAAGQPRRQRPPLEDLELALDTVGLSARAHDRVGTYSFGMRQRLGLAQSLIPRPKLLVLDEPTDGLDHLAILELRDVLRRLRADHGVTVVLSSHLLVELEQLADELLLLNDGRVLYQGTPQQLVGDGQLVLRVDGDGARAVAVPGERGLSAKVLEYRRCVSLPLGAVQLDEAVRLLATKGIVLQAFGEERTTHQAALLQRLRQSSPSG